MKESNPSRRNLLVSGLNSALAAFAASAAMTDVKGAPAEVSCGGLTREQFEEYITLFNNNDPDFIKFYHDDVVLELGGTEIRTPQGIADFYSNVKSHIRESLEITQFISDTNGIAVELPSEFGCFRDWEDSFWGRPIRKGEVLRIISFVLYRVEDGKFRHIRSARYKLVNDWRQEGFSL